MVNEGPVTSSFIAGNLSSSPRSDKHLGRKSLFSERRCEEANPAREASLLRRDGESQYCVCPRCEREA